MDQLTHLIYVSSAIQLLNESELIDLLTTSRINNEKHNISGMLLYEDGNFMQVIEGRRCDIDQLFSNIESDIRHTGIILLVKEAIKSRDFSDWYMSFKNVSGEDIGGFSNFMSCGSCMKEQALVPSKAMRLLISFRNSL